MFSFSVLCTHFMMEHMDVTCVLDNDALYDISVRQLEVKAPSYDYLNSLVTAIIFFLGHEFCLELI